MYSDKEIEEVKALAANYLYNTSKKPELADVSTETRVEYGDAAQSILAAVVPLDVDLIVICSHGLRRFQTLGAWQRRAEDYPT